MANGLEAFRDQLPPLPSQSYCKYNPNNEMRWLGRGVETYDLRLSWTTRSRNSTSTESAFFSQVDYFRIVCNPSRIDSIPGAQITAYKATSRSHLRSHARFLLRLVQQATEEMQWVSGSSKLRSQQPEPVLFDFRFAGLRR